MKYSYQIRTIFKQINNKVLPLSNGVDMELLAVKESSIFSIFLELEPHHQMLFNVLFRTPYFGGECYLSATDIVSVFSAQSTVKYIGLWLTDYICELHFIFVCLFFFRFFFFFFFFFFLKTHHFSVRLCLVFRMHRQKYIYSHVRTLSLYLKKICYLASPALI